MSLWLRINGVRDNKGGVKHLKTSNEPTGRTVASALTAELIKERLDL